MNGFYTQSINCLRCDASCATCNGPSSQNCQTCNPSYHQIRDLSMNLIDCRLGCSPANTFYDPVAFNCKACNSSCSTCDNISTCSACPTGKVIHNSQCLDVCPDGYSSVDGETCVVCADTNCTKCQSTNPNNCISCGPGWVSRLGACTDECPEKKVLVHQESLCRPCMDGCRFCSIPIATAYSLGALTCTKCLDGLILINGQCQTNCPNGTQKVIGNDGSISCLEITCTRLCEECISSTKCKKCHEVDPQDSAIGVFQTFDGRCLPC